MSDRIDALEDLRRQFHAAAEREIKPRARRRRRRRFQVALAFGAVVTAGAVAEGVDLIGTGKPVPRIDGAANFGVPAYGGHVSSTLDVEGSKLPYAAIVFRAKKTGQPCVLAGQLRGNAIGEIDNGRFRSYEDRLGGNCGAPNDNGFYREDRIVDGRFVLYGLAGRNVRALSIRSGTIRATARVADDGAWFVVLDGVQETDTVDVTPVKRK